MELEIVNKYFDAWNRQDINDMLALLAEEATYWDSATGDEFFENALKEYAESLISAFPDIYFELQSINLTSKSTVAIQWVMRGTNLGSIRESLPPTKLQISLPGASFIEIENNSIRSVKSYFNQKSLFEQLGFDNVVQPLRIENTTFGTSLRMSSDKNKKPPGAIALTWISVSSQKEGKQILADSTKLKQELANAPGFISIVEANLINQGRGFTISAWESIEDLKTAYRGPAHTEAMKHFASGFAGSGIFTSLWVPHQINKLSVRCENCGTFNDGTREYEPCKKCGVSLPEQLTYW